MQDCSNSTANALELLQSFTKPLVCSIISFIINVYLWLFYGFYNQWNLAPKQAQPPFCQMLLCFFLFISWLGIGLNQKITWFNLVHSSCCKGRFDYVICLVLLVTLQNQNIDWKGWVWHYIIYMNNMHTAWRRENDHTALSNFYVP